MIKHFLILSSSYSSGKRIALHYVIDDQMNPEMLMEEIRTIKKKCGDMVSISTHYVETDSPSWESVVLKDGFFENVQVVDSLIGFINFISADRVLNGLDIAKYILSIHKCTHLALEKLVYMCYADYLCSTHKKLFEDKIYAFRYGPVIDSVYQTYKGHKEIEEEPDRDLDEQYAKMPARSRILFAEDGIEKIIHIDETLKKYGGFSASELVNITHVSGGPWDSVKKIGSFVEISDSVILEKHIVESQLV